jgi:hypothetical protein
MKCLRPLLGLLATACVGSPPPPPGPAFGTSDDAATTDAATTDATPPVGTSGEGTSAETTTADGTTTAATCEPPCQPGQECIDGLCFDDPGTDTGQTTGEPPPECSLAVDLDAFRPPECGPCLAANCCEVLQACVGDETTMAETECRLLNNCIAMNCLMVATLRELEACANEVCAAYVASWATWVAYQMCAGMNCLADCS